jgi:hypothetical protein
MFELSFEQVALWNEITYRKYSEAGRKSRYSGSQYAAILCFGAVFM